MSIITISLPNGKSTIIDEVDADLALLRWNILPTNYVTRVQRIKGTKKQKGYYLHRMILERIEGRELTKKEFTDHIDGNRLDNRRCNLRLADKAENAVNRGASKTKTNGNKGFKGVSQHCQKPWFWCARIRAKVDGTAKNIYLGIYRCPIEAAKVHDEAVAKYHGKFAHFNFSDNWLWDDLQQCWLRVN